MNIEQVLAGYLHLLTVTAKLKDYEGGLVITVPSYATKEQIQGLHNACSIAKLKDPIFTKESTAILYEYIYSHIGELKQQLAPHKPQIGVFIDIGYSKTTITVAEFSKSEDEGYKIVGKVLFHESDQNLGSRDLDWLLLMKIKRDIRTEHQIDLDEKPKSLITLLKAIEKAKIALSADTEATIIVDSLANDIDFAETL